MEVPDRWRPTILECDEILAELTRLAAAAPPGPLQDRLTAVGAGVAASIEEAVAVAQRAGEVERLASSFDVEGITAAYKRARREVAASAERGHVPEALSRSLESLARQHGSAHRLLNAVDETDGRLVAVRSRLTEIVLSAGELVLGGPGAGVGAAEVQVAALAADVAALRDAFADLG